MTRLGLLLTAIVGWLLIKRMKGILYPPISPARVRQDNWGSGLFNAGRGSRKHQGLDLIAAPGSVIRAPLDGIVTKLGYPYRGNAAYRYVEITNPTGDRVRVMYVDPAPGLLSRLVTKGEEIGTAQDITAKYGPGMVNHIHLEYRRAGKNVDPLRYMTTVS